MFLFICFLLLASIGYWFFTKNFRYWKTRGINGPTPLPIFGNMLDMLFTPKTDLESKYYQKYGNIYGYYLGSKPVLVVGDPELIKTILIKDFNIFPQRLTPDSSHYIMQKNLAFIAGDDWKRVRSITSPTFTSSKMKLMYPLMEDCLRNFMVHLDDLANTKSNVNFKDIFDNLTLDVIASSAFGTKLNSQNESNSLFVKHARDLLSVNPMKILLTKIIPKPVFRMVGVKVDHDSSATESQNFYVNVVRQMIESRKDNGEKFNDFLQILMDADQSVTKNCGIDDSESHHVNEGMEELEVEKKAMNIKCNSSNKKLNEDEVIVEAVTFLVAGYGTTAAALTCATYELALNPEVQDKLCDEVNSSLNANGKIDYEVLCRLPYLDAVISEALRHHPPVAKTNRIASQEYKVGSTGITVYPGQQVDIPIYAIHHDEKYYQNPFKFDPERFMPHNRQNLVPYTYLTFGGGPRNCIGMRYSLLVSKMALAQMVQKYSFFGCEETDVPLINDPKAFSLVPQRAIIGIAMRK